MTKDYSYDAFGVENDKNNADTNPWRYCGEYYDTETGNTYLRARYYSADTGRFMTEDPAFDGVNWYSYCGGNPVMYKDPSGLDKELDDYVEENYDGPTVTLVVKRPVANSKDVATVSGGKLDNGHTFLRFDDGKGKINYFGFRAVDNAYGVTEMICASDVQGEIIDDLNTDWNVAKVYSVSKENYDTMYNNVQKVATDGKMYNIESYNCTTFAINILKTGKIGGNFLPAREEDWQIPDNVADMLGEYNAKPKWLNKDIGAAILKNTMGNFHGYTPAAVAQQMKRAEGEVLLKYDDTGINIINNTYYWK